MHDIVSYPLNIANDFIKLNDDNIKVILDIGANDCNESVVLSKIFGKAIVYAFEPNPDGIKMCNKTLHLTNRIKLFNLIAREYDGMSRFYPIDMDSPNPNPGASSIFKLMDKVPNDWKWNQSKELAIPCVTIDTWKKTEGINSIDLVWMDVQGAELLVLQGMKKSLKDIKVIITEGGLKPYYHGHTLLHEIDAFLEENGFMRIATGKWSTDHEWEQDVVYANTRFIEGIK